MERLINRNKRCIYLDKDMGLYRYIDMQIYKTKIDIDKDGKIDTEIEHKALR